MKLWCGLGGLNLGEHFTVERDSSRFRLKLAGLEILSDEDVGEIVENLGAIFSVESPLDFIALSPY